MSTGNTHFFIGLGLLARCQPQMQVAKGNIICRPKDQKIKSFCRFGSSVRGLVVSGFQLSNAHDTSKWALYQNRQFSVNSTYKLVMNSYIQFRHKYLRKLKLPLKTRYIYVTRKVGNSHKSQPHQVQLAGQQILTIFVVKAKQFNTYFLTAKFAAIKFRNKH